jgi:hypothetical protein
METVAISRDLVRAWCVDLNSLADVVDACDSGRIDAMREAMIAALSAPAGPLTAEECRTFADRIYRDCYGSTSESAARYLISLAYLMESRNAPAWTGPQPVADTTDQGNT